MNSAVSIDLRAMSASPAAFRAALRVPLAHGPGLLAPALVDFQARDFKALDTAFLALRSGQRPPIGRYWIERTKGASKDTDLAVELLWLLAFSPRPLLAQVGAVSADQADELRKAALGILRLNPWLAGAVQVRADALVNPRTGGLAEILSTDAPGAHGARPDLLILNELTHLPGAGGKDYAETLLDNAVKVPNGVVVVVTNAGFDPSWQLEWRRQAEQGAKSGRWHFSAVTDPAPWLSPADIEEARKRNPPSRFLRLWRGVWSAGGGDALPADDLAAALTLSGPPAGPEQRGWQYAGGLDLGLTRDSTALVVIGKHVGWTEVVEQPDPPRGIWAALADLDQDDDWSGERTRREIVTIDHPGTGRLRLAHVRTWRPPPGGRVDLTAVEEAAAAAHQRWGLSCLAADEWQAVHMAQRLADRGVPVMPVPATGPNLRAMASEVLEAFRGRKIDLYADADLSRDLGALRAVERSYGVRLESPRGPEGHGDSATALALALFAARFLRPPGAVPAGQPLVWN